MLGILAPNRDHAYFRKIMALTAKQERFAQHYAQHRNGSAAYVHGFNVRAETDAATIANEASRLLAVPEISARIEQLIQAADAISPVTFTVKEALTKWLEIAAADPNELSAHRVGACRHCWGTDHAYHWKELEYLEALETWERDGGKGKMPNPAGGLDYRRDRGPNPKCPKCEGRGEGYLVPCDTTKLSPGAKALYGGIKMTRYGPEVIIADRTKALENATRIIGGFTDKVRLDGSLTAMVNTIQLGEVSPQEAAEAYMQMVRGIAVNK